VAVHFDGYGDDGTTEEVKCYDASRMRGASASLSSMMAHICRNTSKLSYRLDMRTIAVVSEMSSSM
jgi:hypothetical protein